MNFVVFVETGARTGASVEKGTLKPQASWVNISNTIHRCLQKTGILRVLQQLSCQSATTVRVYST